MKKIIAIFFSTLLFTGNFVFAEENLWENYGDQNSYGQTPVSDKEFDKALESAKLKKFGKKKDKKKIKGSEVHNSNESNFIKKTNEELPVICIPTNLYISEKEFLPIGHYQVTGEKRDGKVYLKFYQAHYLIGEFPAIETEDDYNQPSIHFVKLLENGDKQIKIIFGSIDFNAYSIINIAE